MTSSTIRGALRAFAPALAVGAGLLLAAPMASAAPAASAMATPPAADVSAAHAAAATPEVLRTVGGFFAGHGKPGVAADATTAVQLVGDTVPVYYLAPAFVTASSASVPVATQAFLATEAQSADGQHASVWTARDPHHGNAWTEVNIASGSDETDYTAAAAKQGGTAFYEPQIHAWYALHGDQVLPLNSDAVRSVGAGGMTLTAYQRLVHGRYADKMPGSDYARNHTLGGIGAGAPAPAAPLAQPATSQDDGLGVLAGSLGGVVVLGIAVLAWRRRTAH